MAKKKKKRTSLAEPPESKIEKPSCLLQLEILQLILILTGFGHIFFISCAVRNQLIIFLENTQSPHV